MISITIEWISGRPHTGAEECEARASAAAERVLSAAGVPYAAAEAEYHRQWLEFDDERYMTGLARTWVEARDAADLALTKGWRNPTAAGCSIEVVESYPQNNARGEG